MFANSVSAHSKLSRSRFSYEQNDIIFFIPPVGDLLETEECLYLTTTMECNLFQINFVFLSIIKVSIYDGVIKLLNVELQKAN